MLILHGFNGLKEIYNLHNFIGNLSPEIASYLEAKFSPIREFADRESIYCVGDAANKIYQIVEGEIALCNYSIDGNEIIIARFLSGDCFGDLGLLDDQPRINTAISRGPCKLRSLSKINFENVCDKFPDVMRQYSLMLSLRIRLLLNLVVDTSLLSLPERVARTIRQLSISHGKKNEKNDLVIHMSHEEIARLVAASRQSTSIELKNMEQTGSIEIKYGKIVIRDPQALDKVCSEYSSFETITPVYRK